MPCTKKPWNTVNSDKEKSGSDEPLCFSLSKNPFGLFRQFFAVCCAHNLFAIGEQILHLQPERCFRPRTRRGRKRFDFVFRLRGKFCEAFFDSLEQSGSDETLCLLIRENYTTRKVQVMGASSILPAATASPDRSGSSQLSPRTRSRPFRVITVARLLPSLPARV